MVSRGGRLQPVLMRHTPLLSVKTRGGGESWGGGGGGGGGPAGGRGGGVLPGVWGGGPAGGRGGGPAGGRGVMVCTTAWALGAGEKQRMGGGGQTTSWCARTLLAPLVGPPQHSAVKGTCLLSGTIDTCSRLSGASGLALQCARASGCAHEPTLLHEAVRNGVSRRRFAPAYPPPLLV